MLHEVLLEPRKADGVQFEGRLWLDDEMPGARTSLSASLERLNEMSTRHLVCLAPRVEIEGRSPDYSKAIELGQLPFEVHELGIRNGGVPADPRAFLVLAQDAVQWLLAGENVVVHCGCGIGRRGMFAQSLLLMVALLPRVALERVEAAGAGAETATQRALVDWVRRSRSLYVVELDPCVGQFHAVRERNPRALPTREVLYVGRTSLAPALRYARHKCDWQANTYVRNFGLRLRPDFYRECNPFTWNAEPDPERELAEELRRCGYAVWQN